MNEELKLCQVCYCKEPMETSAACIQCYFKVKVEMEILQIQFKAGNL